MVGISEPATSVRQRVSAGLQILGISLDPRRHDVHAPIISRDRSPVVVRMMKTDEDLMIARDTTRSPSKLRGNYESVRKAWESEN